MITVAIQAGGRSSRMGRDKGLVPLAGKPMIAHVLQRVSGIADEVIVTTNQPADYAFLGLRMASDEEPGAGALPGLRTALMAAHGDLVLLVACDMPFLRQALMTRMLQLAPGADVVVPRWEARYQPMHAVYRRDECLAAVETVLAQGQERMISFYPLVRVAVLEEEEVARYSPGGESFLNVNTPHELAAAEAKILAGEG